MMTLIGPLWFLIVICAAALLTEVWEDKQP
mgnify:CR=1 FL=1